MLVYSLIRSRWEQVAVAVMVEAVRCCRLPAGAAQGGQERRHRHGGRSERVFPARKEITIDNLARAACRYGGARYIRRTGGARVYVLRVWLFQTTPTER
jgi:hypothetical protein